LLLIFHHAQILHRFHHARDSALRFFFNQYVTSGYTQDSEGFSYFKEDFSDAENPLGSIQEI
jgi:hypothetical protein